MSYCLPEEWPWSRHQVYDFPHLSSGLSTGRSGNMEPSPGGAGKSVLALAPWLCREPSGWFGHAWTSLQTWPISRQGTLNRFHFFNVQGTFRHQGISWAWPAKTIRTRGHVPHLPGLCPAKDPSTSEKTSHPTSLFISLYLAYPNPTWSLQSRPN